MIRGPGYLINVLNLLFKFGLLLYKYYLLRNLSSKKVGIERK